MAGTIPGPDARISHYLFCSTYVAALETGSSPWMALRALGMSDVEIEKRRWKMTQQQWMPYGPLTVEDVPRIKALMRERITERQRKLREREAQAARGEFRRQRAADKRLAQERPFDERPASTPVVVLDVFFD